MTFDEALEWIQQVDGRLYQNPHKADEPDAWVAVIRTPQSLQAPARVIVAAGPTLQQATSSAECEWNRLWEELGPRH